MNPKMAVFVGKHHRLQNCYPAHHSWGMGIRHGLDKTGRPSTKRYRAALASKRGRVTAGRDVTILSGSSTWSFDGIFTKVRGNSTTLFQIGVASGLMVVFLGGLANDWVCVASE